MENDQTSTMLKLTRTLFFLNGIVWLIFGALSIFRFTEDGSPVRLVYAILMVANAVVMAWLGVMIITKRNWVVFLGILYVAVNVVLSITDQFGWIDALILLLNLTTLGMLFVTRQRLRRAEDVQSGDN